ncbi:fructose-6-phosphate aldolase [bacterium]|nr:fructose-6-phosphate aldolase [bacterium]
MKFFLDTANLDEIKQAASMGILDGVTTNPSLVAKESGKFKDNLLSICDVVNGPVNAEVVATEFDAMVREGRELAALHPNIHVKIPMIREGLKAVKALSSEGIRVNVTLCFSASQALMAAKAGATFISPFVGRVDDISGVGMDIIADIRAIYDNYGFKTEILAASLRHPQHVVEAALIGADIATLPYKVFDQLFNHPLTDIGLKRFLDDWEKVKDQVT